MKRPGGTEQSPMSLWLSQNQKNPVGRASVPAKPMGGQGQPPHLNIGDFRNSRSSRSWAGVASIRQEKILRFVGRTLPAALICRIWSREELCVQGEPASGNLGTQIPAKGGMRFAFPPYG
jgi:hypothetical protein